MSKTKYITESLIDLFRKENAIVHIADELCEYFKDLSVTGTKNLSVILKCKKDIDETEFMARFEDSIEKYIDKFEDYIIDTMDETYECEFDKEELDYEKIMEFFNITFTKKAIYIDLDT